MKKTSRKLNLSRESLHKLTDRTLADVNGGFQTGSGAPQCSLSCGNLGNTQCQPTYPVTYCG